MPLDDAPKPRTGWHPDGHDPRVIRWWTGRDWSAFTKPTPEGASTPTRPILAAAQSAAPTQSIAVARSSAPTLPIPTRAAGLQAARRTLGAKEIVALVAFALLLLIGLPAGIGGVLIMLGLGGLLVGVYAVIRGRSRVFRLRSRLMGLAALGIAFLLFGLGGAAYGAQHPTPSSQQANIAAAKPTATSSPAVQTKAQERNPSTDPS